jgi:hypothetical protein
MPSRLLLRLGVAGAFSISALGAHAEASPHRKARHPAAPSAEDYRRALDQVQALSDQVKTLTGQVSTLQDQVKTQSAAQASAQADLQTRIDQATAAVQAQDDQAQAAIQTIPTQVDAVKPKTDGFYYKGLKITPGGFFELANQYRSRALGSDMFSPFGSIPFDNSRPGHESEDRFSARQTRLSLLVEGTVNPDVQVGAFGEIDFLGAAQTANFTESNSFTPRLRNLYATIDWNQSGWHLLAGQSWSLATLNSDGITPRNEQPPPQIDAQFVPGFVWTRQPQIRVTKDFDKTWWLALSLESPQTLYSGAVPPGVTDAIANSTGLFGGSTGASPPASAGGGTATAVAATSTLNHLPDMVAKVAYEGHLQDRTLHLEVFGLGRGFTDRIGVRSDTVYGGGVGAGLILTVAPGMLDFEASGLTGTGIGRYGTSQLPDATFAPDGRIALIPETDLLAGFTLHANKALDVYLFGGEEHESRKAYTATYGYGSPLLDLFGCYVQGGNCTAATKLVQQATIGFWNKFYQGSFGRMQVGMQYSYTERYAFSGLGGLAPMAPENIVFTSIRYYPF